MGIKIFEKKEPLDGDLANFILTRIDFEEKTKTLKEFCIIQLHVSEEKQRQIIKYDTAHGHCHAHKYYENINHCGDILPDHRISQKSFNEFKKDVENKWEEYLQKYKRKWKI
ncbi:MAG: hypothetical protein NTZ73_00360 [Candidatus Diapherotrites archaeon]|nr:hypothetical protein [Candidatus Diapherotrites archaeon]